MNRNLVRIALAVGTLGATCALAPAGALGSVDITGTWHCCGAGGAAEQTFKIKDSGGNLSGSATVPSGEVFASISGDVSGSSVTIVTTYNSYAAGYVATFSGKVASSGRSMSGSWKSNAGQSGTWTAMLAEARVVKLPSFATVVCNAMSSTSYTCTADVGKDTPGQGTPSGTVSFKASSGTVSPSCTLSPAAGGIASCSVTYSSSVAIPEGDEPPVTADYSGGSVLDATTGDGTVLNASFGSPTDGTSSVLDANIGGSPATVSSYEQGGTVPDVLQSDVVNTNPFPVSADEYLTVPASVNVANSDGLFGAHAASKGPQVIASVKYSLKAFSATAAQLRLTRGAVKALGRLKHLHVTLVLVTSSHGQRSVTSTHKFVISTKKR